MRSRSSKILALKEVCQLPFFDFDIVKGKEEVKEKSSGLVTTDKLTGETMPEFIKRMLEWKDLNMDIISKITDSATVDLDYL